jgi:hypothetical protein
VEFKFIPNPGVSESLKVPYFEDARANFAPYYTAHGNGTKVPAAQNQLSAELSKLGAGVLSFQDGVFQIGSTRRHGYNIWFSYGSGRGVIRVAGLPVRYSETPKKIEAVKVQALLNVRDWLKAAVTNRVFSPGSDILIPFMLVDHTPGRERTVSEFIAEQGHLPQIAAPEYVGEIID